jgi:hypothetical protein
MANETTELQTPRHTRNRNHPRADRTGGAVRMKISLSPWPNGPISLSPGHRPGLASPVDRRPVGPRYGVALSDAPRYRAPLARGISTNVFPWRCPGRRNYAPLAQTKLYPTHPCPNPFPAS